MISKIPLSSPEMRLQKERGKSIELPVFKENQMVTAKVLGPLSQGKVALRINGEKVAVNTGLSLTPGQELVLKVVHQKEGVLLKLVDALPPLGTKYQALTYLLSTPRALADIARTKIPGVNNILQDLALKSGRRDDSLLPRLIENNGMMWEKKLASLLRLQGQDQVRAGLDQFLKQDLKGALLTLLSLARSGGGSLQKTHTAVLDTLENFQLLNTQTSESGRYLLPFPVFEGSQLSFGQLLLDLGGKNQERNPDSPKVIWVSFLLNLTQLGSVRADFSILKKAITGRFLLERDDIRDHVRALIPELRVRFEQIQYQVGVIECATAGPEQIHPNVLVESLLQKEDDSVVNIVV